MRSFSQYKEDRYTHLRRLLQSADKNICRKKEPLLAGFAIANKDVLWGSNSVSVKSVSHLNHHGDGIVVVPRHEQEVRRRRGRGRRAAGEVQESGINIKALDTQNWTLNNMGFYGLGWEG